MSNTPVGTVAWIGLRSPDKSTPMNAVDSATTTPESGLENDRYRPSGGGIRQVTLFQMEHLGAIAQMLGLESVSPEQTRRNIGVQGINLVALIDHEVQIGGCRLQITGDCPPCSRMETTIGAGAAHAMAGMGGVTARVIEPGEIQVGNEVHAVCFVLDQGSV